MPRNATDTIQAPLGMATDIPAAEVPKTHAQYIKGFVPGRNGKLALAPLLKRIQKSLGITIYGTAVWQSEAGVGDRLLLISSTTIYSLLLSTNVVANVSWLQDEREDGPHSYFSMPSLTTVTTHGQSAGITSGVYSIQMGAELILAIGAGVLFRYYVTADGTGTETIYELGFTTPAAPTLSQTTGGSLTSGQTYQYEYTWVDEMGRESSPSATASITLSSTNTQVTVTQGTSPPTTQGATYWNIYRLNPGATVFKFVAQVAQGTSSYADTASDATVNLNDAAPDDGENDKPATANIMCIWKNRLVLNSVNDANLVQISNAGSPTQFSTLPLPTNLDDGLQVAVGGHGQNQVTGLANLGSLLAIFGRETTSLMYGDDISDFTLRETLQRGCIAPGSVQRCENEVLFMSDDGIYAIGYESGYAVTKRSVEIDDLFRGWLRMRQEGAPTGFEPTSKWRYQPEQTANSIIGTVRSFYCENRYYLSFGNKTICMDVRTGGWSDTGWGLIRTVSPYYSSQQYIVNATTFTFPSVPETVFLTFGDPTTWAAEMYYFTNADTPTDRDAPGSVDSEIVYRPVGADEDVEVRKRRVTLWSQYGTCGAKRGEVIGTIAWTVDGYTLPASNLYAWLASTRPGALFEVSGPSTSGQEIYPTVSFQRNDLTLDTGVFELAYLN